MDVEPEVGGCRALAGALLGFAGMGCSQLQGKNGWVALGCQVVDRKSATAGPPILIEYTLNMD